MSSHGPVISEEGLKVLGGGVSRIVQGILLAVGIISTVISLAGEYAHGQHFLQSWLIENVSVMGAILHLTLIVLILFPGRIRYLNDEVEDPTVQSVVHCLNHFFIRAWSRIWLFFGLLYTVLLFNTLRPELNQAIDMDYSAYESLIRKEALMDVFNVGSTLFIALIYYFMTPRFLRGYVNRSKRAEAWDCDVLRDRANAWTTWKGFNRSALFVVVLALGVLCVRTNQFGFDEPTQVGKLLSGSLGLTSALVLAAFAGRMDSRFIQGWEWVIPVLFLYAAIQSYTGVLYGDDQISRAAFTYSAFTMKCMLFMFVSNFFESRKAIYYAYETVKAGTPERL